MTHLLKQLVLERRECKGREGKGREGKDREGKGWKGRKGDETPQAVASQGGGGDGIVGGNLVQTEVSLLDAIFLFLFFCGCGVAEEKCEKIKDVALKKAAACGKCTSPRG